MSRREHCKHRKAQRSDFKSRGAVEANPTLRESLAIHRNCDAVNQDTQLKPEMDPLLEQMSSVLRLRDRPTAATHDQQRPRRFSDTSSAPIAGSSTKPEAIAVKSRDGSRWLPAPEEQSHRYGTGTNADEQAADDDGPEEVASPLEPHVCNAVDCAAEKVFGTIELLEISTLR